MDSQNANEKIKAHCNNCGGLKNHIVLHTEEEAETGDGVVGLSHISGDNMRWV